MTYEVFICLNKAYMKVPATEGRRLSLRFSKATKHCTRTDTLYLSEQDTKTYLRARVKEGKAIRPSQIQYNTGRSHSEIAKLRAIKNQY